MRYEQLFCLLIILSFFFGDSEGDDDSERCTTRKKVEVAVHLVGHMGGLCRTTGLVATTSQIQNNGLRSWTNELFSKGNTFKHLEGRTGTGTTLGTYYMVINLYT